jgi:cyclopropane fatty-acyl-phospholipid synthase-like methyltransferase
LVGVDLLEKCVALCRERFADAVSRGTAEFRTNDGQSLGFLADASIDFVWSFDVFVHMEADVIRSYFGQFARVLQPGAVGVIHYPSIDRAQLANTYLGWRGSYASAQMLALVDELGFELLHDHYDPMISSTNTSVIVFRR